MRLVKNAPTSECDVLDLLNEEGPRTKIDAFARRVARTSAANQDRTYRIPRADEPHPCPGGLQMVFCDPGTPRDDWNVYDEPSRPRSGLSVGGTTLIKARSPRPLNVLDRTRK